MRDIKRLDENISLYNLKIKSFYAVTKSENRGRVRMLAYVSAKTDFLSYAATYELTYDERGDIINFKRISAYLNPRAESSEFPTAPARDGRLLAYVMDMFTDFIEKFNGAH